jgi:hypothetical protein
METFLVVRHAQAMNSLEQQELPDALPGMFGQPRGQEAILKNLQETWNRDNMVFHDRGPFGKIFKEFLWILPSQGQNANHEAAATESHQMFEYRLRETPTYPSAYVIHCCYGFRQRDIDLHPSELPIGMAMDELFQVLLYGFDPLFGPDFPAVQTKTLKATGELDAPIDVTFGALPRNDLWATLEAQSFLVVTLIGQKPADLGRREADVLRFVELGFVLFGGYESGCGQDAPFRIRLGLGGPDS